MKTLLSTLFLFMLFSFAKANAGTNATISNSNNNKEQENTTADKGSDKYSFTLFNFFSASQTPLKSDSSATESKNIPKKTIKPVN